MVSVLILETGILFPWWPVANGKVWSRRKVAFFPRELKCLGTKKTKPGLMFPTTQESFSKAIRSETLIFSV